MRKILLLSMFIVSCVLTMRAQSTAAGSYKQRGVENLIVDAVTLVNNGDFNNALALLNALEKEAPENDAIYYYQAICYYALEKDEIALECFEKAAKIDPDNKWYKESIASSYLALGKIIEATKIYKDLVAKSPAQFKNAKTLTILGDSAVRERNDSLAMAYYSEALEYNSDYIPAVLGTSDIYLRQGNILSYFSAMNRIMRDETANPQWKTSYLRNFIKYIDASFYRYWGSQIDSLVSATVQASPADTSALHLAGEWFYSTGYKERGRKYFDQWARIYPKDYDAKIYQMQFALFDEDYRQALLLCDTLLVLAGKDKEKKVLVFSTKGDIYHEMGLNKECFSQYQKALRINPDYTPVLNNYAYFLSEMNQQLKKAEKMSAKTIEQEPDNATYLDTYGWILHLLGKDAEAEPYFKKAMATGGNQSKVILEHYADILEALGNPDRASYYRKLANSKNAK